MNDNKFRVLCILAAMWGLLFLVITRMKAPILVGVEVAITLAIIGWAFYWTLSVIRWAKKPEPPTKESEQPNASTKKNDKQ